VINKPRLYYFQST